MSSSLLVPLLIACVFGYLLGSIPFGLILTRAAGLGDVRKIGSGNIGATNVLRTGNKKLAAATLFLDGFKGFLAVALVWLYVKQVLVPSFLTANPDILQRLVSAPGSGVRLDDLLQAASPLAAAPMAAGLGAFMGHVYPVWLGFKGGKGVATYIGVLLGLSLQFGLAFCGLWLAIAAVTRYSSLSSLGAAVVIPAAVWLTGDYRLALLLALMSLLLMWTHRENIRRLSGGTESKIGAKTTKPDPVAEPDPAG